MSLSSLIKNYAVYNSWANKTLIEWLKTNSPEHMDKEVLSSFPGIKNTLIHIWETEKFWLSVVNESASLDTFSESFQGSIDDVYNGLLNTSEEFSEYSKALDEAALIKECYLDTPWVKGSLPRFEFIQHVMNHSTYHRGQITTMSHHLGLNKAPMTDYNFYNMMAKK